MNRFCTLAFALVCTALVLPPAEAADQPIAANKLEMRISGNGRQRLVFQTRDPAFLLPAPGSADDPAAGTPGGLLVEIFSATQGAGALAAGKDDGDPGWTARTTSVVTYKYHYRRPPAGVVKGVTVKGGRAKSMRIDATGVPIPLGEHGSVGIRISMGTMRSCALFGAGTIRKQTATAFVATGAVATSLVDCSDASLVGAVPCGSAQGPECNGECPAGSACSVVGTDFFTCQCISAAQPCGTSGWACNGECPVGEECFLTGFGQCSCLPPGSDACGMNNCGGVCPAGQECNHVTLPSISYCECGPPGPCGSGGDDCPAGTSCVFFNGQPICLPVP